MNNSLEGTVQRTNTSADNGITAYAPENYIVAFAAILAGSYVVYRALTKYLNSLAKKSAK